MQSDLRKQSIGLLNMLALQFILGMILNLFVTIPAKHPGQTGNYFVRSAHSFAWAISIGGGVTLFLHVLVAIGLLFGSIAFVVRATKAHSKLYMWVSIVGLVGILAAFSNGLSFLDFNKDFSSFIMAMGYILATIAYVTGIFSDLQQFSAKAHSK
jgi:hypothetical protein